MPAQRPLISCRLSLDIASDIMVAVPVTSSWLWATVSCCLVSSAEMAWWGMRASGAETMSGLATWDL